MPSVLDRCLWALDITGGTASAIYPTSSRKATGRWGTLSNFVPTWAAKLHDIRIGKAGPRERACAWVGCGPPKPRSLNPTTPHEQGRAEGEC